MKMAFKINNYTFLIEDLVGKSIDDSRVQLLISSFKKIDYQYYSDQPSLESIESPEDEWSCHISPLFNITFEFLQNRLNYIAVPTDKLTVEVINKIHDSIIVLERNYNHINYLVFTLKNDYLNNYRPNRYIPILDSGY